jgi:hypothetical protein
VQAPKRQQAPQSAAKAKAVPELAVEAGNDREMADFVGRCLEPCDGASMTAAALFAIWRGDCEGRAVDPRTQKAFSGRIKRHFEHDPNGGRPRYRNVKPKVAVVTVPVKRARKLGSAKG